MSAEQHALLDARRVLHNDAGVASAMKPAGCVQVPSDD